METINQGFEKIHLEELILEPEVQQINYSPLLQEEISLYDNYRKYHEIHLSHFDINNLKEVKTFKTNHQSIIHKLLFLDDNRYATCSSDQTIRIWSLDSSITEQLLLGHTDAVIDITRLANGNIASASFDGQVKIWNIKTMECEMTLQGHSRAFVVVELPNEMLITGGFDGIRIWKLKGPMGVSIMKELKEIGISNSVVILNEKQMAVNCGFRGEEISILSIFGSDIPIMVLKGHTDVVTDILSLNGCEFLLSSSVDGSMIMWNLQMGNRVRVFREKSPAHKMVLFNQSVVATCYYGSEILFWNLFNGACLRRLNTNQEALFGLVTCESGELVSYGRDGTVKFWSN